MASTAERAATGYMPPLMRVQNTIYAVSLSNIKPESDQASRFNHQFTGDRETH